MKTSRRWWIPWAILAVIIAAPVAYTQMDSSGLHWEMPLSRVGGNKAVRSMLVGADGGTLTAINVNPQFALQVPATPSESFTPGPVPQDAGIEANQVCYTFINNCPLTVCVSRRGACNMACGPSADGGAVMADGSSAGWVPAWNGTPVFVGETRRICVENLSVMCFQAMADAGQNCLNIIKETR